MPLTFISAIRFPRTCSLDLSSVLITPLGGAAGLQNNSVGNTIDIQFDDLPVGSSVTVTYDATLLGTVQPGETLQNTAAILLHESTGRQRHSGKSHWLLEYGARWQQYR